MDAARRQGLRVLLLTLTVRHGLGDDVRDVLARMRAAWRRYTGDRQAKAVRAAAGLVGTIRALEVTHGVFIFILSIKNPRSFHQGNRFEVLVLF